MKEVRIDWGESYQICQFVILFGIAHICPEHWTAGSDTGSYKWSSRECLSLLWEENKMKGAEGMEMTMTFVLRQVW